MLQITIVASGIPRTDEFIEPTSTLLTVKAI